MDELSTEIAQAIDQCSTQYLGQWNRLVSTTNWEKGRIICQWRQEMIEAGAPAGAYSDETWSRRVGNVSPQHVGRLRRAWQRFGEVAQDYAGLYWTHFQAALDWPDAEMWLEGAVHEGWSVAQMRTQRWESLGALPDQQPRDEDIVQGEFDEDADRTDDGAPGETVSAPFDELQGSADDESAPFDEFSADSAAEPSEAAESPEEVGSARESVRPFAELPALPDDLSEALEQFKLAILTHKASGWRDVTRQNVLDALEALKQLALAPAE